MRSRRRAAEGQLCLAASQGHGLAADAPSPLGLVLVGDFWETTPSWHHPNGSLSRPPTRPSSVGRGRCLARAPGGEPEGDRVRGLLPPSFFCPGTREPGIERLQPRQCQLAPTSRGATLGAAARGHYLEWQPSPRVLASGPRTLCPISHICETARLCLQACQVRLPIGLSCVPYGPPSTSAAMACPPASVIRPLQQLPFNAGRPAGRRG